MIIEANLRNRFSFLPEIFSQVQERYIFLNFQNFRETGSVKIANGKITLCAEREIAITFVCNWGRNARVNFICPRIARKFVKFVDYKTFVDK